MGNPNSATTVLTQNPPFVSVAATAPAVEGGTAGTFQFFRTGDTSLPLTVSYGVGGSAVAGTNYTALSGSVTFSAGSSTANVSVSAIDDSTANPGLNVVAVVEDGTGYVGSLVNAASMPIIDSSTGIISGKAWNDANDDGIMDTSENPLSDVTATLFNGTTQVAQTVTDSTGQFQFTGVAPGSNCHIQFTPLAADNATLSPTGHDSAPDPSTGLTGAISVAAGQNVTNVNAGVEVAAAAAPYVELTFTNGSNVYYLQMTMTVDTGNNTTATYSFGPVFLAANSGKDARAMVADALQSLSWSITTPGDYRIDIFGYQGWFQTYPVKDITYTVYGYPIGYLPQLPNGRPSLDGHNGATSSGSFTDTNPPAPTTQSAKAVWVSFSSDPGYSLTFTIQTDGGQSVTSQAIAVTETTRSGNRDVVFNALTNQLGADWIVEKAGDGAMVIRGKKKADGSTDPVKSVTMKVTGTPAVLDATIQPLITGLGGATGTRTY